MNPSLQHGSEDGVRVVHSAALNSASDHPSAHPSRGLHVNCDVSDPASPQSILNPDYDVSPLAPSSSSSSSSSRRTLPFGLPWTWRYQLACLAFNLLACGAIVGCCRLLPKLAEDKFNVFSHSSVLLFIVSFGLSKALANMVVGSLAEVRGRRVMLLAGWSVAFIAPLITYWAINIEDKQMHLDGSTSVSHGASNGWYLILVSTTVIGAAQGLCLSTVVIATMDITPPSARGGAMGVLECLIYVSLGLGALAATALYDSHSSSPSTSSSADFSPVLLLHLILCAIGLIAAWLSVETRTMPAPDSDTSRKPTSGTGTAYIDAADRTSNNNSNSKHSNHSDPDPRRHSRHEWSESDEESGETSVSHYSDQPATLHWSSLRDDNSSNAAESDGDAHDASISSSSIVHRPIGGSSLHADPVAAAAQSTTREYTSLLSLSRRPSHSSSSPPSTTHPTPYSSSSSPLSFTATFLSTCSFCFRSRVLRSILQAGLMNNLKDGVCWGLFPAYFTQATFAEYDAHPTFHANSPQHPAHTSTTTTTTTAAAAAATISPIQLGWLLTLYPLVWGLGQLFTGRLSDRYGKALFIWLGLGLQGLAMAMLVAVPTFVERIAIPIVRRSIGATSGAESPYDGLDASDGGVGELHSSLRFGCWLVPLFLLGVGTALCYPVLQAFIGDYVVEHRRAPTIGLFRLGRDSGYVVGGLMAGILADRAGVEVCLGVTALMLLCSAVYADVALNQQARNDNHHDQVSNEAR